MKNAKKSWSMAERIDSRIVGDTDYRRDYALLVPHPVVQAEIWFHYGVNRDVGSREPASVNLGVRSADALPVEGNISVGMRRTASRLTADVPLWIGIRKGTERACRGIATPSS